MNTEKLFDALYEVKTLVVLYSDYAKSAPKTESESRGLQKEMKVVKEDILKRFAEMKTTVKRLETEVRP